MLAGPAINNYWVTWFPGALLAFFGLMALIYHWLEKVIEQRRTIQQVQTYLPMIAAEFNPNGGHSMKDRIESLHRKQDELRAENRTWQSKHAHDDDRRFAKVEASLDRIEDNTQR